MAGLVPGFDKPGQQVRDDVVVSIERPPRFVSRGGEKLAHALDCDLAVELRPRPATGGAGAA